MFSTIIFRYAGTLIQFVVLSSIARNTTKDVYGLYILCLSVVFSAYYIVGFGASEAAVIKIPRLPPNERSMKGEIVGNVLLLTAVSCVMLGFTMCVVVSTKVLSGDAMLAVVFILVFLAANGVIFNSSQILLATGRSSLGAFFFYPAINMTLLFSTVPVVLLVRNVSFGDLISATIGGAILAAIVSLLVVISHFGVRQISVSVTGVWKLVKAGCSLMAARILHVASFWIPTFVTGVLLSPSVAGVIGTAGRLAISVSAIIAALRFVVRPALTRAVSNKDVKYLKKVCGSLATLFLIVGAAAIFVNERFGDYLIPLFFGQTYSGMRPILTVFLIGVLAEGIFGPVDELLKMSGYSKFVMVLYAIHVPLFLFLTIIVAKYSWELIPWVQVLYVLSLFSSMNIKAYQKIGYLVRPIWPDLAALRTIR